MLRQRLRNFGYFFILVSFYFFGLAAFNLVNFLTSGDLNRLFGGIFMLAVGVLSFQTALVIFRRARNR